MPLNIVGGKDFQPLPLAIFDTFGFTWQTKINKYIQNATTFLIDLKKSFLKKKTTALQQSSFFNSKLFDYYFFINCFVIVLPFTVTHTE